MNLRLWNGNLVVTSISLTRGKGTRIETSSILLFVDDYYVFTGISNGYCNFTRVEKPIAVEHWFE